MDRIKLNRIERKQVLQDIDERMRRLVNNFQWQYDSLAKMKKRIEDTGEYP